MRSSRVNDPPASAAGEEPVRVYRFIGTEMATEMATERATERAP